MTRSPRLICVVTPSLEAMQSLDSEFFVRFNFGNDLQPILDSSFIKLLFCYKFTITRQYQE